MGYRQEDEAVPKRAGSASSAAIIRRATLRALTLADEASARTIGFPALATGVGGFPIGECAEAMVGAVREYARSHPMSSLELVAFVVRGTDAAEAFGRAIER